MPPQEVREMTVEEATAIAIDEAAQKISAGSSTNPNIKSICQGIAAIVAAATPRMQEGDIDD